MLGLSKVGVVSYILKCILQKACRILNGSLYKCFLKLGLSVLRKDSAILFVYDLKKKMKGKKEI